MNKPLTTLICLCLLLTACGNQPKSESNENENASEKTSVVKNDDGTLELEAIAKQWGDKVITLDNGGQAPNIEQLVEAFNKTWPTAASKGKTTTDTTNGYSTSEVEGQTMTACFWKRNNGHRLFAVNLSQPIEPTINTLMFYDYDPTKGTLTPEKSPVLDFKPGFEGNIVEYNLPQKGKDIVIKEFVPDWEKYIKHTYSFDGTKHNFARTDIDDYAKMKKLYDDKDDMYRGSDPTMVKYALVDIDQDGSPELWTRSENEEDGAFYAINQGKIWLLETENYHSTVTFHKGIIQQSGGCGTGCQVSTFTLVKNSKKDDVWKVITEYGFGDDDEGSSTWWKNEKEIPEAEGDKFMNALDDGLELNPKWHPFAK